MAREPEVAEPNRSPDEADEADEAATKRSQGAAAGGGATYIRVYDTAPEGYDGDCLRPLGLCELGGCCDSCWYGTGKARAQNPPGE